jgi:hypothetical protein
MSDVLQRYPQVAGPEPDQEPALEALLDQLQARFCGAVDAVLVYGSCLRSGDIYEGLLDLYLLLRNYRDAHTSRLAALANWLLPPNVYYAEVQYEGRILRSKVTVISREDFRHGCSWRWFQSYLWGRFAQPVYIARARNARVREEVEQHLQDAVRTLLGRTLPRVPAEGSVAELWERALSLCYATELRSERRGRASDLVEAALPFYEAVTWAAAPRLSPALQVYRDAHGAVRHDGGSDQIMRYRSQVPRMRRRLAPAGWALRRLQGKTLSVARLIKALFTFDGGLDYLAWKLSRHSGQEIVIPARVRRHPLLLSWPFFWRLYRRGIFR